MATTRSTRATGPSDLHEWDDGRLWAGVYVVRCAMLVALAVGSWLIGAHTVALVVLFAVLPFSALVGLLHRTKGRAGWLLPADQYLAAACLLIDPRVLTAVAVCQLAGAVNAAAGAKKVVAERSILAGGVIVLAAAALHRDLTAALFGPTITFSAFALGRFVGFIQHRAASANARFEDMLDGINAFVVENDVSTGKVLYMNRKARELLGGFKRGDRDMVSFVHADDRARVIDAVQKARTSGRPAQFEVRVQRRDGTYAQMEQRITFSDISAGRRQRNVLIDISSRKKIEGELQHRATHDELTNLANRRLFHDRLDQAILRNQRNHRPFAILVLDVDKFKQINDRLGHAAGDDVLRATAERLTDVVRSADTVARLGGDEFAVLLEETDAAAAVAVAERCAAMLAQPVLTGDAVVSARSSIGIVVAPKDGKTADVLMRHADVAMYQSKRRGTSYHVYTGSMDTMEIERITR
jgi:diguanylate cyclase (GGDEF)-like protein/PAS domain S-box-containing protein